MEIHSFNYSFHKYLLSSYYVPSPRDITAKKTKFLSHEMYLLKDKTENKQIYKLNAMKEKKNPEGVILG